MIDFRAIWIRVAIPVVMSVMILCAACTTTPAPNLLPAATVTSPPPTTSVPPSALPPVPTTRPANPTETRPAPPTATLVSPALSPVSPTVIAPRVTTPQPAPPTIAAAPTRPATRPAATVDLPIYDTHLHYSQNAWQDYSTEEVLGKLERAGVLRALLSSSPDDGTRKLYELAPDRIVPILRPYYDDVNSGNWYQMGKVTPYLAERLKTPIYKGIGEFHLTPSSATAPVVVDTARKAVEHGFFLHVHGDAQTVRIILSYEPTVKILWAHVGLIDTPATAAKLLAEHPNVWADIAIRENEIAPSGKLAPAWRDLFLKYPDRFTIGSDTWVPSRWETYEQIIEFDRQWLLQLPRDVAEKIAYRNAVRLFGAGGNGRLEE